MTSPESTDLNTQLLLSLKNRYAGRRCFVIGNGPSLRAEDLDRIQAHGDLALASNRIHLIFDRTAWRPTFGLLEDMAIARASGRELGAYFPGNLLFADYLGDLVAPSAQFASFRLLSRVQAPELPPFSEDFSVGSHGGATITYTALQLAYWLGVSEVYLLGVDCNYVVPEARPSAEFPGLQIYTAQGEQNHFAQGYLKPNEVVFAPDMDAMRCAFKAAQAMTERSDRFRIFNATRGGKLEVFPRVDFDQLFGGAASPAEPSPAGEGFALARRTCLQEQSGKRRFATLLERLFACEASELRTHGLIDCFGEALVTRLGDWGDASCGEVQVAGRPARTILLHPPAKLAYTLPTGAEGTLSLAIGLHPEVWENAQSGPCRFSVRVNGATLLDVVLDAQSNVAARRWHAFHLAVPATGAAPHTVELETEGVDGTSFRWGLWRDPVFLWREERS